MTLDMVFGRCWRGDSSNLSRNRDAFLSAHSSSICCLVLNLPRTIASVSSEGGYSGENSFGNFFTNAFHNLSPPLGYTSFSPSETASLQPYVINSSCPKSQSPLELSESLESSKYL